MRRARAAWTSWTSSTPLRSTRQASMRSSSSRGLAGMPVSAGLAVPLLSSWRSENMAVEPSRERVRSSGALEGRSSPSPPAVSSVREKEELRGPSTGLKADRDPGRGDGPRLVGTGERAVPSTGTETARAGPSSISSCWRSRSEEGAGAEVGAGAEEGWEEAWEGKSSRARVRPPSLACGAAVLAGRCCCMRLRAGRASAAVCGGPFALGLALALEVVLAVGLLVGFVFSSSLRPKWAQRSTLPRGGGAAAAGLPVLLGSGSGALGVSIPKCFIMSTSEGCCCGCAERAGCEPRPVVALREGEMVLGGEADGPDADGPDADGSGPGWLSCCSSRHGSWGAGAGAGAEVEEGVAWVEVGPAPVLSSSSSRPKCL